MANKSLVSVVIPTYNRSDLCRQAVESALGQTHRQVEVIVVDDGSTDNTKEAVSQIGGRVRYIRQANAGVAAARNTGLEAVHGEYVAFLDSDDTWLAWKLEAQLAVLDRFPSAGMVWTDMRAVTSHGKTVSEAYLKAMYSAYRYFEKEHAFAESDALGHIWPDCPRSVADARSYVGNISSWMFMGNLVHTSTALLRRERQRQVGGFDLALKPSGEDYDFHFRTCQLGDVAYLDVSSINYRVGAADQLTSAEYMIWIARHNLKTIMTVKGTSIALPERLVRQRIAESHNWVGEAEFGTDKASARRHFISSLATRPWQPRIWAYSFASFLPHFAVEQMRALLRARFRK